MCFIMQHAFEKKGGITTSSWVNILPREPQDMLSVFCVGTTYSSGVGFSFGADQDSEKIPPPIREEKLSQLPDKGKAIVSMDLETTGR